MGNVAGRRLCAPPQRYDFGRCSNPFRCVYPTPLQVGDKIKRMQTVRMGASSPYQTDAMGAKHWGHTG
jgi:hypothetical protein